jgi:hypothetical protein
LRQHGVEHLRDEALLRLWQLRDRFNLLLPLGKRSAIVGGVPLLGVADQLIDRRCKQENNRGQTTVFY